jgi:hypothetical protein
MQQQFRLKQAEFVKVLLILAFTATVQMAHSAEVNKKIKLNWLKYNTYSLHNVAYTPFITFTGAQFNWAQYKGLPIYTSGIFLSTGSKNISVSIKNEVYEELTTLQNIDLLSSDFNLSYSVATEKKADKLLIELIPIRKNIRTGKIERLLSFELAVKYTQTNNAQPFQKTTYASTSVLATGNWLKFNISQTGIYAITAQELKNAGFDIDNIDPRTIKVYGQNAGMLPQLNSAQRFDDLPENAIVVEGESDGVFNETDRIVFYGQAQKDVWKFNSSTNRYDHITNIYTDKTCYFITYGGLSGKRVTTLPALPSFNRQSNEFDHRFLHELDAKNLIKSGRLWLGEEFGKTFNYTFNVGMGNMNTSKPLYMVSAVAARSFSSSSFSVAINGTNLFLQNVSAVEANFERPYADDAYNAGTINVSSPNVTVSYQYNTNQLGSAGWLDYFELQSRNFLKQTTPQFTFRDAQNVGPGFTTEYTITTSTPVTIWDVTKPTAVVQLSTVFNGTTSRFIVATDSLREFISFTGEQTLTVSDFTKVANQNLHGLAASELFIITHPQFINESQTLANLHRTKSGIRVNVITTEQIYNEFSSGNQDLSAIRDFLRMFYKKALSPNDLPKYVTLFGRASYDYKNRIGNNTNFVPTYESVESFDPVNTYNSDDYLGLLDDNEGKWDSNTDTKELLDIAIGRLPAQNNSQANDMVNKIIRYVNSPTFGDWKTKLVFVADDEDYNIHQTQANDLAENAISEFPDYNIRKIFIDAYQEENASGGARNPEAQSEIVRAVEQGAMIINYTGHGGEIGWAAEQILTTDNVQKWTNGNRLPLFVTATCEFSRFDDPARTSAGEMVLLNPNGGGIALFTTVRLVNSGSNLALNTYFYDHIGLDSASAFNHQRLGEILRLTKNDYTSNDKNERNFTLLGDPAMFLAYPTHKVVTTQINQTPVNAVPDTLKAFAKVTISGKITDISNNHLSSYNGVVYPTVYDKTANYQTIANNPPPGSSPMTFTMQNNMIYRGKASVVNGNFSFTFIVPKDIAYEIGYGKLSYAADNGTIDAIGNYQNIMVGQTSDSIPSDGTGPEIKLFMNDEKFVYGGITNPNPTLLIKLHDANGINITGRGVGRDISMVVNNDANKTVVLNEYYQAKLDSYQDGEIRFPMKDLPLGKNMLKTRAFDIYNNPTDAMLEFVVAGSEELALQHILNYPNPFTTQTTFHFDHNKAGEPMTVQVQIYTISGKLIKTLQTDAITNGNHFDQLSWDGRDDYGDAIGKGVYIYKVKVQSSTGKTAEDFQKLVILN